MSPDRAQAAINEYGQVATLNFGNIAALSAEGLHPMVGTDPGGPAADRSGQAGQGNRE